MLGPNIAPKSAEVRAEFMETSEAGCSTRSPALGVSTADFTASFGAQATMLSTSAAVNGSSRSLLKDAMDRCLKQPAGVCLDHYCL
mmetsp:Transcript_23821/g.57758  ORF Transcript_23821/g.57758 Transcript_23821/m.57758 type:complete len:86 (+) Transcript_23821:349-606(+)